MDAYGTKIALDLKNCRKKLKKFEDAEKRRKEKEATFYKWADNYSKKKPGKMEMGADAVLRDLGIDPNAAPSLGEAVAAAAAPAPAAAANTAGASKNGGRRRKTKKRRRKRKTKRKKRKTKKRRRKRKRKTKKRR